MVNPLGWYKHVWNPITGCSKVSEGCRRCWIEHAAKRMAGRHGYSEGKPLGVTFHPDKLHEPLKWRRPQRIFVCSMGDWMHEDVDTKWIDQILDVMGECPQHTFLTLTKRPWNLVKKLYEVTKENPCRELGGGDYLPNLWLGVSVEDQPSADDRIPFLFHDDLRAFKKLVSYEPAIGPADFSAYLPRRVPPEHDGGTGYMTAGLNWLIMGAEASVSGARHMDPTWARAVLAQCRAANVPFLMKQTLGRQAISEDLMVREFPKI